MKSRSYSSIFDILEEFDSQISALEQLRWVRDNPEKATRLLWYLKGMKR